MPIYVGINGTPKKVKELYVGVNGSLKKVKTAYCGTSEGIKKVLRTKIVTTTYTQHEQIFTSSGTFDPSGKIGINIFMVGGGGRKCGDSGGGGGYTKTTYIGTYSGQFGVTVGAGGGDSSCLGNTASSGGWTSNGDYGGNGGSGGGGANGGSNGNDGGSCTIQGSASWQLFNRHGGLGQGSTTRAFGYGTLYAGGGAGGAIGVEDSNGIYKYTTFSGGAGGGGNGSTWSYGPGNDGAANTGGGAGGGWEGDNYGGSGIVIIQYKTLTTTESWS